MKGTRMIDRLDFDALQKLFTADEFEFEKERTRILQEYFLSLPEDRREEAVKYQAQLESMRKILTTDQYSAFLWGKISSNLKDLMSANDGLQQLLKDLDK